MLRAVLFILERHSVLFPGVPSKRRSLSVLLPASLCQSVMNMMHVISIPYALMKVNPLSWIQKVCQHKGKNINLSWGNKITNTDCSLEGFYDCHEFVVVIIVSVCVLCVAKVACVKSRDMHWALVAHREQRDVNLSSLRMLVVADGSNPCKNKLSRTLRHLSCGRCCEENSWSSFHIERIWKKWCQNVNHSIRTSRFHLVIADFVRRVSFRVNLVLRRLPQRLPV